MPSTQKISLMSHKPTPGAGYLVPVVDPSASSNKNGYTTVAEFGAALAPATNGWQALNYTPTTVTYNGNRNYTLVFNSVDLTGTVSTGMRLKTTRTVTAPTQCTSLNGSTQYFSKTSPAGMTFTATYTAMAWVNLAAYQSGMVISRHDGSTGWWLNINANGQIVLRAQSGAGARELTSYRSVPLNKWVHIAANWDLGTGFGSIYIDDVSVNVVASGTAITTLTQAGTLMVGNAGSAAFFNGKIAQAAVFSSVLSFSTIRSYISQGLSGTEPTLVSAYSFNNSITDLNATNANNLTANASAASTNVDSPFCQDDTGTPGGTTDFGVITSKTFSTNTTLTVRVPEGCAVPTSGGVSAVSYSTQKCPYGFPEMNNALLEVLLLATFSSSTIAGVDVGGATTQSLVIPTNKSIRVTAYAQIFKTGSAGDIVTVLLYEDSVVKQEFLVNMSGSNYAFMCNMTTPTFKPTAGSHTYKLAMSATGAGTMQFVGNTVQPAFLRVEVVDL